MELEKGPGNKKIRFATVTGNTLTHGSVSDLNVARSGVPQNERACRVPTQLSFQMEEFACIGC